MASSYYPDQTRRVAQACAALGLEFTELDGGSGYLFSVANDKTGFIGGAGAICAYPLNSAAAVQIARDKAHANTALAHAGVAVIPSRLYFTTDHRIALRGPGREVADAVAWIRRQPGPVFCKPNTGSEGDFAEIIDGVAAFLDYIGRISPRHEAILVQPLIAGDEYRVFYLDGEAVFATRKADAVLRGDGVSTLSDLIAVRNATLTGSGVSPTPTPTRADRVLAVGEIIALPGRRNLAAGGEAVVTTDVPSELAGIALAASRAIGLRVSGIDVFDVSPARDLSDLVVIEINGNPALTSLAQAGREDLAGEIWRRVLSAWFAERRPS